MSLPLPSAPSSANRRVKWVATGRERGYDDAKWVPGRSERPRKCCKAGTLDFTILTQTGRAAAGDDESALPNRHSGGAMGRRGLVGSGLGSLVLSICRH